MSYGISSAQDITGTWEGSLGTDQFIQLNVIQVKNKICGYTYDYVLADQKSHCKAYFIGDYDKRLKEWTLDGESFIENSGSHILMHIRLAIAIVNGRTMLVGSEGAESSGVGNVLGSIMSSIFGKQLAIERREEIRMQKTGNNPRQVLEKMKDCYEQKLKEDLPKPPVIKKPPNPIVKNIPPVIKKPDSIARVNPPVIPVIDSLIKIPLPPPPDIKTNVLKIPEQMVKRRNIDEGHITVNTRTIILDVYDNGIVDGDTVSIFFNGKLLLSHERLSEKAIEIKIELDEKTTINELILFAENLGSIPPNTALVVVHAGEKRYELFSKASLEENAMLIIEYHPE